MKKIMMFMLVWGLLFSSAITVFAEDSSREYYFELSVDGSDTKQVQPGDIITVVFELHRTDSDENYDMYSMQNEIRYDSAFFRLVKGSELLSDGINTTDLGLLDEYREFYMNFVSFSGGEEWNAQRKIGSFQLEVIGQSGVSKITNQDYLVSTADGQDHFKAACQDVTIVISTDCTVNFESNGGSQVSDQTVQYGEKIKRPEDPTRDGYTLEGWYADINLKECWDFDADTVQGNMTLYAKWQEGAGSILDVDGTGTEMADGNLWWLLALGLLGLLLLLLLFGKKRVKFETGCSVKIKTQKVKKGGYAQRPENPQCPGRIFVGWYSNEERTVGWDFENEKVKKSMTLYAKWM